MVVVEQMRKLMYYLWEGGRKGGREGSWEVNGRKSAGDGGRVQFGVSLKLDTLQDYFQHSESVQKVFESSHLVGCTSSFEVVGLHLQQTAPTSFLL